MLKRVVQRFEAFHQYGTAKYFLGVNYVDPDLSFWMIVTIGILDLRWHGTRWLLWDLDFDTGSSSREEIRRDERR